MRNGGSDEGGRLAGAKPSLTARGIAGARAQFGRPSSPRGNANVGVVLARDLGRPLPIQRVGGFVAYVRGRTRFFDEQVQTTIEDGPCQIVVVGAGYDDRAYRFAAPHARFIEVDHPATQADKRARLDRLGVDTAGIVYLPVDFGRESFSEPLAGELEPDVPTMFLCESVLPYLHRHSAEALLRALGHSSSGTARLVADLPVIPSRLRGRITFHGFRFFAWLAGEPVRTTLAPAQVAAFLESGGWSETRRTTGEELGMPAGRAEWLFVVAEPTQPG
jgi:methyltransferase (TIGR00027 family)